MTIELIVHKQGCYWRAKNTWDNWYFLEIKDRFPNES